MRKNHLSQVRRFTWVRTRQNPKSHSILKVTRLHESGFVLPRRDITWMYVSSHVGGMIFSHLNRFWAFVLPRRLYVLHSLQTSLKIVSFRNSSSSNQVEKVKKKMVFRLTECLAAYKSKMEYQKHKWTRPVQDEVLNWKRNGKTLWWCFWTSLFVI